ncbi:hypothetical protein SEA_LUZDEMUNDO_21 [Microbacterium phage LuzDeMundo]|nr:membrane protein [Microbacterium phage DesireeRose]UVG34197.1 hypothetical protein SEA_LUZDEMUNDO_21 [Microbacterium phage LuzDeMundo]
MNFDLKEKLGPLPVWAWGVMVGLLLVAGIFVFRQKSNTVSNAPTNVVGGTVMDPQGYQTAGIRGGNAQTSEPSSAITPTASNASWLSDASRAVAGKIAASPSAVYSALQRYIAGQALSAEERRWVDQAINLEGSPPDGTYGIVPGGGSGGVQSLGNYLINDGNGSAIFELYNDGSGRWIDGAEWGVLTGRGEGIKGTKTIAELNSQYGTRRTDDPA